EVQSTFAAHSEALLHLKALVGADEANLLRGRLGQMAGVPFAELRKAASGAKLEDPRVLREERIRKIHLVRVGSLSPSLRAEEFRLLEARPPAREDQPQRLRLERDRPFRLSAPRGRRGLRPSPTARRQLHLGNLLLGRGERGRGRWKEELEA